jgi:hypothetical protein
MKPARLIKMCLSEAYSKFCIGKHWQNLFTIENGLKQGIVLSLCLSNLASVTGPYNFDDRVI